MKKFTAPNIPAHDASKFTWRKEGSAHFGCTEASDLADASQELFGRVFRDACDYGCILFNDKKETQMQFVVEHAEINDNDLLYWRLYNYDESKPIRITIFND